MQVESSFDLETSSSICTSSSSVSPASVEVGVEDSHPVDLFINKQDSPPIAPPRANRGKLSTPATLITHHPSLEVEDDSGLIVSSKQCSRQRQPARLLMPVKCDQLTGGSSNSNNRSGFIVSPNHLSSVNQLTAPSSFWTQNRYPSASEFDTTRLNVYLNNNFTKRGSFYTRGQVTRAVPVSRLHQRSKSVDRTYKLAKSSMQCASYQRGQNVLYINNNNINNMSNNNNTNNMNNNNHSSLNINNSHHHNNNMNNGIGNSNNQYTDHVESTANNLNRIVSSIRAVALNAAHRALILTRSESLQSDSADSASTLGDNDNELSSCNLRLIDPPKSALKKSSSTGLSQLTSATAKNVTFSAYTTIQVVDK